MGKVWEWKEPEPEKGSLSEADVREELGTLPVTLMEHQVEGFLFLRNTKRCILADETGLGKTITSLAASIGKTLILCPKYVASKWVEAASQFGETVGCFGATRKHKEKALKGFGKNTRFVVTNYETLTGGFEEIDKTKWECVIVDEAQFLQGRGSNRSKKAKALLKQVEQVFLLTATPVWNQPDSLWMLLHLLYPKSFSSYWRFVNKYCIVNETPFGKEIKGNNPYTTGELRKEIEPFVIRRLKKDILSLGQRNEEEIWLDVDPRLLKENRNVRRLMRDEGRVSLERARYHLLDRDSFDFEDEERLYSGKIPPVKKEALEGLVKVHRGGKMLVFCVYQRSADKVHQWLVGMGLDWLNPTPITGRLSVEEREKLIEDFKAAEGTCVLVGTARTMGTGLDLQAATIATFVEHPSLCSEVDQCIGRVERIGSVETAWIYHLIQRKSLDEKVYKACKAKQEISEAILCED